MRNSIKRLLNSVGWDIRKVRNANLESTAIANLLKFSGATAVLDVGANIGQYGQRLFATGYRGRLISFEAIPTVHAELVRTARRWPSWHIAPCAALGSQKGYVDMNIAENSVSSSILPMNSLHVAAAPESRFVSKERISIDRLDAIVPALLVPSDRLYLKIDAQGYEMEVLKGASGILDRTMALQIELSLVNLYSGAPDALQMLQYLDGLGYGLFGVVPGFRDDSNGRLLQLDGFFARHVSVTGRSED